MITAVYPPVIIQTALTAGIAMGMQAGLQFLGIGDSNVPSWGAMMLEGFRLMLTYPLMLLWPSAALGLTIAVLAIMGSTLAELVQVRTPRVARRKRDEVAAMPASAPTGSAHHSAEGSALRVENLRVVHATPTGETEVVHGVTLDVAPGEVVGIVGESGSGKSQTVFSVLDLLPATGARHRRRPSGWAGSMSHRRPRSSAGPCSARTIGYVPQEPMSNLDPSYTIGHQLIEPLRRTQGLSRSAAKERARAMLVRVGLTDPDRVMRSYPHQVSGGGWRNAC